jgi:cation transporter-like permease
MSQYLIDCRGINLILSILKENTFREIALQVIFIITTALLKQMFKVLLSVNPR